MIENKAIDEAVVRMLNDYNKFPVTYQLITYEQWMYKLLKDAYSHTVKLYHKQCVPPFAMRKEGDTWPQFVWSVRLYRGHLLQIGLAKSHTFHMDRDREKFPWARHPMCKFFPGEWREDDGYFTYFFTYGCQHKNTETWSPYMFEHRVKCVDCGYRWGYDSSG